MKNRKLNHKTHWALAFAPVILLFTITTVWAVAVPRLKGRVNDYAGMLSSTTERQLDDTLRQLEQTDATQIAVLTIPSLKGDNLEAFSIRVAEQWKIGQKGFDNGAILLIAKKERKIRIEVGYGLEGRLTDLVSGQIIRNVIVPQFRAGNIDRGISDGVQSMIKAVRGEFKAPDSTGYRRGRKSGSHFNLFSLIIFLAVINMLGYAAIESGKTGRGLALLRFNAEAFPGSANAHDSLGEAWRSQGDDARALAAYRRALELDPDLESARRAVEELSGRRGS